MASSIAVPVEQYLKNTYEPDCEYADGELIERHVGEFPHSRLQGLLFAYFLRRSEKWNIVPIIEQRIRISETRFLIPDICVLQGPEPTTRILTEPPFIWIEILSSEDRPIRVNRNVREVLEFGAQYVWVIDPETLESYVAAKNSQMELVDGILQIQSLGIVVPLADLKGDSLLA